jgi:hypothetical protein
MGGWVTGLGEVCISVGGCIPYGSTYDSADKELG